MAELKNGTTGILPTNEDSYGLTENNTELSKEEKNDNVVDTNSGRNNSPHSPTLERSQTTSVTTTMITLSVSPKQMLPAKTVIPKSPTPPPPPPPAPVTKPKRTSEVTTQTPCPICHAEAIKRKNAVDVLKCGTCNNFVHFACTNLPPYVLFSLSSTNKKYTCEVCTETPEPFLTNIINNVCVASSASQHSPIVDNRIDILENKVNNIMVALDKFDLQTLTDNLNTLGTKMETTNNNLTGNVRAIQQLKKEQGESEPCQTKSNEVKPCNCEGHSLDQLEQLRNELEFTKKELAASRSSNELLMGSVTERDQSLTNLREKYEKTIQKLNERDRRLTVIEGENKQLMEANTTASNERTERSDEWSLKVQILSQERDQYLQKLEETQDKFIDVRTKLDTNFQVNTTLREQVQQLVELNKSLQATINRTPDRQNLTQQQRDDEDGDSGGNEVETTRDEVVILHDSMCGKINDSLLSREKVTVKKVWAPDLDHMEEALDDVDAKVVVLAALTRDLDQMETNEMNERITGLVSKALTKANKVVISTIIMREDVVDIDLKVNLVNAHIKMKYKRNDNVVVCDNYKLDDPTFRKVDKLHLNDNDVSILASNLKYSIAEAVGVQVIKKQYQRRDFERRYDGDRRYNDERRQDDYRRNDRDGRSQYNFRRRRDRDDSP